MSGCRKLNQKEVEDIMNALTGKMKTRDRAWFYFGIDTGFRISEILSLKRKDFIDELGEIKSLITVSKINMKGQRSSRSRGINETTQQLIRLWLIEQQDIFQLNHSDNYVFTDKKGNQIKRIQPWRILKRVCLILKISSEHVATHSMRKTFCDNSFNHHKEFDPVDAIALNQKDMGHKSYDTTLLYRESINNYKEQKGVTEYTKNRYNISTQ